MCVQLLSTGSYSKQTVAEPVSDWKEAAVSSVPRGVPVKPTAGCFAEPKEPFLGLENPCVESIRTPFSVRDDGSINMVLNTEFFLVF